MSNFITDNLDIWTSARVTKKSAGRGSSKKQEAYGIKKLRELILELAVRGKLVPQDPSDEPASVLLEKIVEEKKRLVEEGKIKKQKPLSQILDKDIPFELPNNWVWSRLGNTGIGATGKTPSTKDPKNFDGNIPFIGPGQITPSGEILEADKFVSELGIEYSTEALDGDILMVCIGGSIGKSAIANQRLAFNQQINLIRPLFIISKYLKIAVSTDMFYVLLLEKSTGSATPIINRGKWEELLVPFPPLEEQHRIVSKVDELMALCDTLEEEQEKNGATHQLLVETLLGTLSHSDTSKAFEEAWQRIAEHFDVLFTTEKSVGALQETILQLAVMGKLVPQDPSDEPASVLLENILEEQVKLVKEKKIKKPKKFTKIKDDEYPFSIPNSWEFVRLNDIGDWGAGATPTRGNHKYYGGTIPWFKSGELSADYIFASEEYVTELALEESSLRYNKVGDVLIAMYGATIGKVAILEISATTNQAVCACTPFNGFSNIFLLKLLKAYRHRFINMGAGGAQPNISREKIIATIVPLPPLEEQHRIVSKVDELMALCDSLKSSLREAKTTQVYLADTVAKKIVE